MPETARRCVRLLEFVNWLNLADRVDLMCRAIERNFEISSDKAINLHVKQACEKLKESDDPAVWYAVGSKLLHIPPRLY